MGDEKVKSEENLTYNEQLDVLAMKVLEVDSDVNEDQNREKLLDDSLDAFLSELSRDWKEK
jgi:hypothetical protein